MPIFKRNPKSKESKKTVTPNYVEKTKSKTKGTKPVTTPSPTTGPKPDIGSLVSKPRPTPVTGGTKPRPGGTTPKPKPNPGVSIPLPRTKPPVAGQSNKLNVEKLRQIAHNRSRHDKGQTVRALPVGKKAGSTNRVLRKGGSTKRK